MPVNPISPFKSRLWTPWLAGFVLACAVLFGWEALNRREDAGISKTTAIVLDWLQTVMQRDLDARIASLRRIADRWSHDGGTDKAAWEADVANYLNDQPGYHAIAWADTSLHVQWSLPGDIDDASLHTELNLGTVPDTVAQMPDSWNFLPLSAALRLDSGEWGFQAYYPVVKDDSFDGLIIAVFQLDSWLESLLNGYGGKLFGIQVLLDDQDVYDSMLNTDTVQPGSDLLQQDTFFSYGRNWTVKVWLTGPALAEYRSQVSEALLILGLLASTLLTWALRANLLTKFQSELLQIDKQRMDTQWKNLPGMAYRSQRKHPDIIDFVSEGCQELTGYSKSEFQRQRVTWDEIVHAEDRQIRTDLMNDARGSGRRYSAEYRIVSRSGQEKWVWERGAFNPAPDRNYTAAEGLVIDITELKQTKLALSDSISYANTVVETAAEGIITISTAGEIEAINHSAQQMFAYAREEVLGRNIRCLMPEPYHAEHDGYIEQYLKTGVKSIIGVGREVKGRRKDGSVFPIQLSVSEFMTKDERKFVGMIRDLTAQQLAEHEARLHRERLAHVARVNMLGEMATGIAHEINQPLSAISMYAQSGLRFLDADPPKPERLRDVLQKLSNQAHRAAAVIERMQQFARQRDSRYEEIDCNLLMQQVAHLAESEALIRDSQIRLDLDREITVVSGDPIQLQQVALNLLRNGMESMEGIDHRFGNQITLQTRRGQDEVTVSVIDQGAGVSDQEAAKLYQPFASTKEMGMGIGLSICKSIIHSHGGTLDFSNNEDHGATFFFTLPDKV